MRKHSSVLAILSGAFLTAACSGDPTGTPRVDAEQNLFWALTLNHQALNLSTATPWNTTQLVATPQNPQGQTLSGAPVISFRSTNPAVTVTADGMVTANTATSSASVIASLSWNNITKVDTVFIRVVNDANPRTLASLAIDRTEGDTLKAYYNEYQVLYPLTRMVRATLRAANNDTLSGLVVRYWSTIPDVAGIDANGLINIRRPGTTMFFVETTAFGVTRRDSIPGLIGPAMLATISIRERLGTAGREIFFDPQQLVVARGAVVMWSQTTQLATNVVFDDSTQVAGVPASMLVVLYNGFPPDEAGNIATFARTPDMSPYQSLLRGRLFPNAGTYHFHSAQYGSTGTLLVKQ